VTGSEVIEVMHLDVGEFVIISEEDVPLGGDKCSDCFVILNDLVDLIGGKENPVDVSTISLEFTSSMRQEVAVSVLCLSHEFLHLLSLLMTLEGGKLCQM
jgi:hypothetical protein